MVAAGVKITMHKNARIAIGLAYKSRAAAQTGLPWRAHTAIYDAIAPKSSYFLKDTPTPSPCNSPRSSPCNSPCSSICSRTSRRNSLKMKILYSKCAKSSPSSRCTNFIFLQRNVKKAKLVLKRSHKEAKALQHEYSAKHSSTGAIALSGVVLTRWYGYQRFNRKLYKNNPICDEEASLTFKNVVSSTLMKNDMIRVHARSDTNKPCSTTGGAIYMFQEHDSRKNIMIVSDSAGQLVYLDATMLIIRRA